MRLPLSVAMRSLPFTACVSTVLLLLLSLPADVESLPPTLRIGGLFEAGDNAGLAEMFRFAVNRVNWDNVLEDRRSNLEPDIQEVNDDDSFHASKKVCQMLKGGLVALFGPSSESSSAHVQSIADTLHVPHLETRRSFKFHRPYVSLNIHPHPVQLSRAFYDVVYSWGWKSFAILFEADEGLVHMQQLLKNVDGRRVLILVRQLSPGDDHRPLLKEIKKAVVTKIILDCSTERVNQILTQARNVGMMNQYYSFLVTSLDLHLINLEPFQNSFANISGFTLVQPDRVKALLASGNVPVSLTNHSRQGLRSGSIKTEAALLYDAVLLLARALGSIGRDLQSVPIRSCDAPNKTWDLGSELVDLMKHRGTDDGLTGRVIFDDDGFRRHFELQLVAMGLNRLTTLGVWTTTGGLNLTQTYEESLLTIEQLMQRKPLRVVAKLSKPFVQKLKDENGKDVYVGYSIDLMNAIVKSLKLMNYTMQTVENYGTETDGKWDGVIGQLIEQSADVGIGDLTITYKRERVVDFTQPFMNLGISILFKKDTRSPSNLFSFTRPLSSTVWVYLGTAYLGVSVVLFLLARFNPYDWENPHPCDPDPDELENKFSLMNSMWFTIGSLMQQGFDLAPKAISTRLVAGIWWFFTMIMVSSYTANLAAFLTAGRMTSAINNVHDLAQQTKVKYGCIHSGSTKDFFKNSSLDVYQTMWSFMESEGANVFTPGNEEGVDRVKRGGYAFIMESTVNEYFRKQNCELTQIGGQLDSKSYGIALPPGSKFRAEISRIILELQENGTLQSMKKDWWRKEEGEPCPEETDEASSSELGLDNVGGVFVVLLGGMGLACVVGILEFVWKTRKTVREERGDFWEELKSELKFAMQCGNSKKPVARKSDSKDALSLPLTNYS